MVVEKYSERLNSHYKPQQPWQSVVEVSEIKIIKHINRTNEPKDEFHSGPQQDVFKAFDMTIILHTYNMMLFRLVSA